MVKPQSSFHPIENSGYWTTPKTNLRPNRSGSVSGHGHVRVNSGSKGTSGWTKISFLVESGHLERHLNVLEQLCSKVKTHGGYATNDPATATIVVELAGSPNSAHDLSEWANGIADVRKREQA